MQKSGCQLMLNSRNRINTTNDPSSCVFKLQDTINASKFELTHFSFANILYNVTTQNNTLYINGDLAVTVTPGFWTAASFISEVETQLESFFEDAGPFVVLNVGLNTLSWTLDENSITSSPMNSLLGVFGVKSGDFTTTLFLVSTTGLCVTCSQLQAQSYNSYPNTQRVSLYIPINSGYGDWQIFEPSRSDASLEFTQLQFDTIQFNVSDSTTGAKINMGEWQANFIVS